MDRVRVGVALLVVTLLSTGCGARLRSDQVAAVRGAGTTGGATAARQGSATSGATATTVAAATGPSTAGPSASAAGPEATGGSEGAAAAASGGACAPTGGATDVGVTDSSITVGSVATVGGPVPGLFKNVQGGAKAYFNMVNSQGGVCGRKIDLQTADDRLDASQNRSATEALKPKVFAFVGSYSVLDGAGAAVLAGTGIPDIGSSISAERAQMAENFSMTPTPADRQSNGAQPQLQYFIQHYGVSKAAIVWPAQADARNSGQAYVRDMNAVGLQNVQTFEVSVTETNYAGVANKIKGDGIDLLITVLEVNGITRLATALDQTGYHPKVSFYGQQAYGSQLIKGGGKAVEGTLLALTHDIVENAPNNPAMAQFTEWFQRTNPGDDLDFFAIQGWIAGAMFVKALQQAGAAAPTRAAVLGALQTFHAFDADGVIAPADPAGKKPSGCFHIVTIEGGQWKVVDPASGFTCG